VHFLPGKIDENSDLQRDARHPLDDLTFDSKINNKAKQIVT